MRAFVPGDLKTRDHAGVKRRRVGFGVTAVALTVEQRVARQVYQPRIGLVCRRRQLLDAGYEEIPVTSLHALELAGLPLIHRDPFDRLLIAQAMAEGMRLLTADRQVAFYPGPILKV